MKYGYAMILYRWERWCYTHHLKLLAKCIFHLINLIFSCSIPYTCILGKRVNIAHSIGIVIHSNSEIGDDTIIYQNVTIGNARGPKIGKNCVIGAGAVILGDICIGNNVKIGANTVVNFDVPDNCTVVGVKGRIIKKDSFGGNISES